ncbi:PASTA domain-containing protein [Mycolicibacterium sp. ELW1]|uniref:PASTA domain-containing protein n=1 Tax=unclassified Mycolicibacterium TaxID=2636767 RepID=UPI0011EC026F|nr:PASTA domain-containing protein [Mycobacterium sp. ELW1]
MKLPRGLIITASTVFFIGACSSAGQPVVATESSATTAAPAITRSPQARSRDALVMPDLRGMYWADADPALATLGWSGVLDKGPSLTNTPYARNQIAVQTPAPGQVIASDAVITLQFAA